MGEELMNDMLITAENVFDIEIEGLRQVKECLGETFSQIVDVVAKCEGKVVLCGMGKSGHIAKKISATLASLGTPSFFLHPAEAQHGDLGMVTEREVVILISHSGESEEIVRLLPSLRLIGATLIAITSNQKSTLAQECEIVQLMPPIKEACALNLAPTSSTTAVLVYGDALAVDLGDDGKDVLDHQGGQPQGGLVQHHQLGAGHEGPAHGQHLLLAAGQGAGQLPAALLQAGEELIDPLDILFNLSPVLAEIGAYFQIFQHRHIGKDPPALGTHGDAGTDDPIDGFAQQLLAIPLNGARLGLDQAGDGAQSGGFAGAVGPDEGDDFAVGHLQADAAQGLDSAVGHMEIFNFKHPRPPPDRRL